MRSGVATAERLDNDPGDRCCAEPDKSTVQPRQERMFLVEGAVPGAVRAVVAWTDASVKPYLSHTALLTARKHGIKRPTSLASLTSAAGTTSTPCMPICR